MERSFLIGLCGIMLSCGSTSAAPPTHIRKAVVQPTGRGISKETGLDAQTVKLEALQRTLIDRVGGDWSISRDCLWGKFDGKLRYQIIPNPKASEIGRVLAEKRVGIGLVVGKNEKHVLMARGTGHPEFEKLIKTLDMTKWPETHLSHFVMKECDLIWQGNKLIRPPWVSITQLKYSGRQNPVWMMRDTNTQHLITARLAVLPEAEGPVEWKPKPDLERCLLLNQWAPGFPDRIEVYKNLIRVENAGTVSLLKDNDRYILGLIKSFVFARDFADDRWGYPKDGKRRYGSLWDGKSLVRQVRRLDSPLLTKYMPKDEVYRVTVYNPSSAKAGRELFPYTLILRGKEPIYLNRNDKPAADFISNLKIKIADERSAKEIALLFALLRDYDLQEKQKVYKYNRVKSKPEDWGMTVEKDGQSWVLMCAFMSDPVVFACGQWKLTIDRNGSVSAAFVKSLFRAGGYK